MTCRKVLVVTNMYPTDADPARGAFVRAQVGGLEQAGVKVRLIHLDGRVDKSVYWSGRATVSQASYEFDPDFVYAFYGLTGWTCLSQHKPIVLSLAGDDVLGTPGADGRITAKSRVATMLSQWAALRASVVCVQSDEMRRRLWTRGLRSRARVVPYGVDAKRFSPGDRVIARRRIGIADGTPLVIFPNTPSEPRKRLGLALEAIDIARRSMAAIEFKIVNGVTHDSMADYFRAADCTLLTSDWEGSPNVVKESLFCGTPVVTTDVGDVRRWIPLARWSAIAERTPEAIAAAMLRILDGGRREDPAPFVGQFSVEAVTSTVLQLASSRVA